MQGGELARGETVGGARAAEERRNEPEGRRAERRGERETGRRGARGRAFPRAWGELLVWWVASRALVIGISVLVVETGWPGLRWRPGFLQARGALELLGAWDGRWYTLAASHGYVPIPGYQSDAAFFPLLPLLLRALHGVGLSYAAAGILLANLGFLAGLLALYEVGKTFLPEAAARRAAVLAAIFPLSFVDSMLYPEGIAFAALACAGLAAARRRWLLCAACCTGFALSRPEGFLVCIPVVAAARAAWPTASPAERSRAVAASLSAPAALAGFVAFSWLALGGPFAWSAAERAWERSFSPLGPLHAVERLAAVVGGNPWPLRDVAFLAVYAACLVAARRAGVPGPWVLFGALLVLLPLASGTFESDGRFGLLALPVYWGLGAAAERRQLRRFALAASPLLLAAGVLSVAVHSP